MNEDEWQDVVDTAQQWDKNFKHRTKSVGSFRFFIKEIIKAALILICISAAFYLVCVYLVSQVVPDIPIS